MQTKCAHFLLRDRAAVMRRSHALLRLALSAADPALRPRSTFWARLSTASAPHQPTERVSAIVDEISRLSLLEVADLAEALRSRLGVEQMPVMAILTPGMGGAASGFPGSGAAAAAAAPEAKEEKTAFDLKLESFDAASKIKIIKEVRTFTDLGLKEAKELVEKAPTVLKTGVPKEEAEKIMEKMKEIGAKVVLE